MMASQATDCSTTKPVAVVAPCRRLTNDSGLTTSEQASTCDDVTEHEAHAGSVPRGHEKVSDDRQRCSKSTEDAARSNEFAVDQQTSTYTVVEPDNDDNLTTCPFYHGNITSDEAKRRLAATSRGTFLLRDSQSTSFPFSLSVQTSGQSGVTSLRIARDGNDFRLDCDEAHRAMMPRFDSVLRLVGYFVAESDGGEGGRCLLVGSSGRHGQPLTLRQPLHRPSTASK